MNDVIKAELPAWRLFVMLLGVCFAVYSVGVMSTGTLDAMVKIRNDLNMSPAGLQWITNAYLLFSCSFMIVMGRISEIMGRRNVFIFGAAVFAIGAVIAAFADSAVWLIIGRAIQGFGASVVTPVALAILKLAFPPKKQALAVSFWSVSAGLGFGTGPIIGGAITDGISWRGLFWLNVILLAICLCLILISRVPNVKDAKNKHIDWYGTILLLLFIVPLVLAAVEGNTWGWSNPLTLGLFAWSAVLFCILLVVELRLDDPLVMFRFFKIPTFSLGAIGVGLNIFNLLGILFFLSLFMQTPFLLNYSAIMTGVAFLPMSAGFFLASLFAIKIVKYFGFRASLIVSCSLQMGGFLWLCFISPNISYLFLWGPYLLAGLGLGFNMGVFPSLAMMAVPDEHANKAAGLVSTMNYFEATLNPIIGTIFLIAIGSHYLTAALKKIPIPHDMMQHVDNALLGHTASLHAVLQSLPVNFRGKVFEALQYSTVAGYVSVMIICASVAVVMLFMSIFLAPGKSHSVQKEA